MRIISLLLTIFATVTSWGVPESQYDRVYAQLNDGHGRFYQHASFRGVDDRKVVFTKFGQDRGEKGSVVVSPGRTESSLKYLELAMDLIEAGYSPVYVINHRGQGFSSRWLEDSQKGHVDDYADYRKDFVSFIQVVRQDPAVDRGRLFAVAHSMGGAILMDALMENGSPFRAVVLSAPLFRLPLEKSEQITLRDTFLACYIKFACQDYVPGGAPFSWENRRFEGNDVTQSPVRFAYRDQLWRMWPQLQLGSPTIRWVRETIQANIKRRDLPKLRRIGTPILILQAGQEQVVDNQGHREICDRIGKLCRIQNLPQARHEILMEKDSVRDQALASTLQFFAMGERAVNSSGAP